MLHLTTTAGRAKIVIIEQGTTKIMITEQGASLNDHYNLTTKIPSSVVVIRQGLFVVLALCLLSITTKHTYLFIILRGKCKRIGKIIVHSLGPELPISFAMKANFSQSRAPCGEKGRGS